MRHCTVYGCSNRSNKVGWENLSWHTHRAKHRFCYMARPGTTEHLNMLFIWRYVSPYYLLEFTTFAVDHDPNASLSCAFAWKPLNCRLNCNNCYWSFPGPSCSSSMQHRKKLEGSGYEIVIAGSQRFSRLFSLSSLLASSLLASSLSLLFSPLLFSPLLSLFSSRRFDLFLENLGTQGRLGVDSVKKSTSVLYKSESFQVHTHSIKVFESPVTSLQLYDMTFRLLVRTPWQLQNITL